MKMGTAGTAATSAWGDRALVIPAVALAVAFFLPWIDIGDAVGASGYDLARSLFFSSKRFLLWLAPGFGAAAALAALSGAKSARNLGTAAGAVVLLPAGYYIAKAMVYGTSFGLWMVVAGAIALTYLAVVKEPQKMTVPAILLIGGFFLPWTTSHGNFASWGATGLDVGRLGDAMDFFALPNAKIAYAIPFGGAIALLTSLGRAPVGRMIGGAVGVLVLGWLAYFMGSGIAFVSGVGMWLTLAAAAACLIIALRR